MPAGARARDDSHDIAPNRSAPARIQAHRSTAASKSGRAAPRAPTASCFSSQRCVARPRRLATPSGRRTEMGSPPRRSDAATKVVSRSGCNASGTAAMTAKPNGAAYRKQHRWRPHRPTHPASTIGGTSTPQACSCDTQGRMLGHCAGMAQMRSRANGVWRNQAMVAFPCIDRPTLARVRAKCSGNQERNS